MARAVERFLSDRRQLATTRTLLEAEQQRLTAIIDNTADSIVVLQGGRVLQLNRAAERMFGISSAQAADQPGDALLADFDWNPGAVPGIARDALARSRDGSTTPVEVSLNPVTSGTGSLVVLVIRDATLRRQAEQHLIAARDAAEAARETQAVFLANISHELRTPLNGILGFAQILRRDEPLTERQARGLKIIEESGQHLLMLIDDILDLARIDKAKLELHPIEVDLPAFLQGVCDIVRVKAEEKRLMLRLRGGTRPACDGLHRREATAPGAAQPAVECHQVQRRRAGDAARKRRAAEGRRRRRRLALRGRRQGHRHERGAAGADCSSRSRRWPSVSGAKGAPDSA